MRWLTTFGLSLTLVVTVPVSARDDRNPFTSTGARSKVAAAIAHYEKLTRQQAWEPAPARRLDAHSGSALNDPQRAWVIARLMATRELPPNADSSVPVSDAQLSLAVKKFQRRHGLLPDGLVWPETWQALNTSPWDRAQQLTQSLIELNRLADVIRGDRYLLVNIPAFEVSGIRHGKIEIRSAVVVGKRHHKTPVLDTRVRAVNFHPRWHVPPSIVASRLYPALAKDPQYLAREGYELFHAATGQRLTREQALAGLSPGQILFEKPAGPRNPLGRIRLDMPNADAIFLHDSPQTWLFARPARAMSAGCVRVARIVELTAWLLEDTPYADLDAIGKVLHSYEARTVNLETAVPIHLAYFSAWVDTDGQVQFRSDIYQRGAHD
ncbi:MAG: L,D-transpeptidase family protein [Burkholderiaceae bacterium]